MTGSLSFASPAPTVQIRGFRQILLCLSTFHIFIRTTSSSLPTSVLLSVPFSSLAIASPHTMALMSFQRPNLDLENKQAPSQKPTPPQMAQRSCTPSIKIRPLSGKQWDDDEPALLQEHYDCATLRMYYRIIDYRNRHPVNYDDVNCQEVVSRGQHREKASFAVDVNDSAPSSRQLDSDAIFEMDL